MENSIDLKGLRAKHSLSQYKLALLTGIARHKITMVECGYDKLSFKQSEKIIHVLEEYQKNKEKRGAYYE